MMFVDQYYHLFQSRVDSFVAVVLAEAKYSLEIRITWYRRKPVIRLYLIFLLHDLFRATN